jgi:short-subunit dehydrogenase
MREAVSSSGGAGRTALITGASAGIGKAFAEVFAARGFDLVLVARREERLRELARGMTEQHGVQARAVAADLADPASPERIHQLLQAEGIAIDALVNNAGYGLPQDYTDTSWADQAAFLQVTATAVAHLIHLFLPGMVERGYGRIINVSSLGALLPGMPGFTLYSGVKSLLVKTSQSLTLELKGTGVHVTAVCPGFTYSEFHDVTETRKDVSRLPRFMWMTAEEVARESYDAVMAGKPVLVNGRLNRFFARLLRHLPDSLATRSARRQRVERS